MKKFLFAAVICIAAAQPAFAEDDVSLERIVVTPIRSEEYIKNSPNSVSVITRKSIEGSTAKNIPDILREEAGIDVRELYAGNGKSVNVDLRGFGESAPMNTLILVDGRRVTQIDLGGTDWIQIPLGAVERIEVIRGAGSVLYGDNAVGGVINIITRDGRGKPYIKATQEAASYASYDTKVEFGGEYKGLSFSSFNRYYHSAGYRNNNDINSKDFDLKLGYRPLESLNTKLSLGFHRDHYGMPGALYDRDINDRGPKATIYPLDDAETLDYFGDFTAENDFKKFGKLSADISMRIRQIKTNTYMDSFPTIADSYIKTFGFTPKYTVDHSIAGHKNKIIAGFDFYDASDHVENGPYNAANDVAVISKRNYGVYFLDQFSILQNLGATLGYRYDHARYNFEQIDQPASKRSEAKKERNGVITAGLNYIFGKYESSIFANYSESFRLPMVDEFFSTSAPNVNPLWAGGLYTYLDPQSGKNYEIGIRHNFNNDISAGLSLFRMDLHNEIWLDPVTYKNYNYDHTRRNGVELESKARLFKRVNLFANYTFTDALFIKGVFGGNQVPAVPQHKWSAGFDFDIIEGLNFALNTNYVGERYFISDQNNKFPRMASYITVDTRLGYKKRNFSLYGGIKNLFDEDYYEYGVASGSSERKTYYPAPGRNFFIGGSVEF